MRLSNGTVDPANPHGRNSKIAIRKWLHQSIADGIIRPSEAPAWSQLMLTPKPNGTWRFAIDYRAINKYTKAMRALIPNINKLLLTIGANNPKYFAKMDFTSGFYQLPLDEECMKFTAFATDFGLFEFARPSMGLLNSPWYFQGIMEREVFQDLINKIMAVYIDDLLTWANNIDDLCANLEKIFKICREKGLVLHPDKCEFGLTEVEFVGHLIDESGMTFTTEKLAEVEDMPLPDTKGTLKSFLGLGNFFLKQVADYATLAQPLNDMLPMYEKKHAKEPLVWTPLQAEQFKALQTAIVKCRKIYYQIPGAPIQVYTDASDYGIGAYLCQVKEDGTQIPIEFISKTLTKTERRWSTYEKEAFAIFYSLRKWEHHLRDVKFTLFTDHKNLKYLTKDPSAKVMRWRMAVQDYSFDVAYIPGEENIIADGFSRLCHTHRDDEDATEESTRVSINSLVQSISQYDLWQSKDIAVNSLRTVGAAGIEPLGKVNRYVFDPSEEGGKETDIFCSLNAKVAYAKGILPRQFIPRDKMEIVRQCHNYSVGHWGVQRTVDLVRQMMDRDPKYADVEWHCMRKDIDTFISNCDVCNKMDEQKLGARVQKYTTSEYGVMKCLSLDVIYMPKCKSGNKYILTVIDTFSRYTALYAIKNLTAATAAKVLVNHMCLYGVPIKLTTDNCTEYDDVFKETLEVLATENYRIQAYSHQENGIVERANKEVLRHLRALTYELRRGDTWDEELLKVQAIINSRVSEATGLSPIQLLFAGQVDLYEGRIYPQPTKRQRESMSKYMKEQLRFQEDIMEKAVIHQQSVNEAHMSQQTPEETPFEIGAYLSVQHESGKMPDKLAARWHGPYRILDVVRRPQGKIYVCYSPATGKTYDFHETFVKSHPCKDDLEAARINTLDDKNLFMVEHVVEHRIINIKGRKSSLDLHIKWLGYPNPEWTGLNISLKRNYIVQEYLEREGLAKQFGLTSKEKAENKDQEGTPIKPNVIKKVRFIDGEPGDDKKKVKRSDV